MLYNIPGFDRANKKCSPVDYNINLYELYINIYCINLYYWTLLSEQNKYIHIHTHYTLLHNSIAGIVSTKDMSPKYYNINLIILIMKYNTNYIIYNTNYIIYFFVYIY